MKVWEETSVTYQYQDLKHQDLTIGRLTVILSFGAVHVIGNLNGELKESEFNFAHPWIAEDFL